MWLANFVKNLDICKNFLCDIILKEDCGLVIETISNKFIEDPVKVLTILLTCQIPNKGLHFVSLYADYDTWNSKTQTYSDNLQIQPIDSTNQNATEPPNQKSAPKSSKKASTAKSEKNTNMHNLKKTLSPDQASLFDAFENYGIELGSFLTVLGVWVPMVPGQDTFDKKLNDTLSLLQKSLGKDSGKSNSQKKGKSEVKEQSVMFPPISPNSADASSGVNVWIFDYRKNHLCNIHNFIRVLQLMDDPIVAGDPYESEADSVDRSHCYLIVKKPEARQLREHTNTGFKLISERQSEGDDLLEEPRISSVMRTSRRTLSNIEPTRSKFLKVTELKLTKSKKKSNVAKKKIRKSSEASILSSNIIRESTTSSINSAASSTIKRENALEARVLLEPNQKHSWQVVFEPQQVGYYEDTYELEVARGRKRYQIRCKGHGDFPRLNFDPDSVFCKVADTYASAKAKSMIFLKDINTFRFGFLFAKPIDVNSGNLGSASAAFNFHNNSELDVELSLTHNEENDDALQNFSFEPKTLFINKSSMKTVSVWAHPVLPGRHEMTLVCSIRKNPENHFIKVSCDGVEPNVQFMPPELILNHVLIGRKSVHNLLMINQCDLPMRFELEDAASLVKGFSITPTVGRLKEHAQVQILFEFTSTTVQIVEKNVEFKFFKDEPGKEILLSKTIKFNIECYDVFVDVLFPTPKIPFIDFGNIKIEESSKKTFSLKNKGKFDIAFEVELYKVPGMTSNPKDFLSVEPKFGTIHSGKVQTFNVICSCSTPLKIVESPVIRVRIMDLNSNNCQVSVIPIPVSAKLFYSSCKISPAVAMNFGPMLVNSTKEKQIQIENTGLFNFKYRIFNAKFTDDSSSQEFCEDEKPTTSKSKKTPVKKNASAKSRNKAPSLEIAPFVVEDSCGTIEPGVTAMLKVVCMNPGLGECIQDVIIRISGSECPEGWPFKLLAYGCSPQVDVSNLDFIFQEAQFVDKFDNTSFETIFEPKIAFSKNDLLLLFCNILVGSTANINLHFSNADRLPSDLTVETVFSSGHLTQCFTVQPTKETIGPHSTKLITVSFNPTKFEVVSGEIVISTGEKSLKIALLGEGVFPQLEIVRPVSSSKSHVVLSFQPTLLSCSTAKTFALKNVGKILCKVVIEEFDECKVFTWKRIGNNIESKYKLMGLLNEIETDELCMKSPVFLAPKEECGFEVTFVPETVASYSCNLQILVVNNPYESFSIKLDGSGYQDDIIMRELVRMNEKEKANLLPTLALTKEEDAPILAIYSAYIGPVYVGRPEEKIFKICSLSKSVYRFEWEEHISMTVSPRSGFLHPHSCKDICLTFQSEEQLKPAFNLFVTCSLVQVELTSDHLTDYKISSSGESFPAYLSSKEESDLEMTLEPRSSPKETVYSTIQGTWQKIAVLATGVVDNPDPHCEVKDLTFPDTLLFQISEQTVDISNLGLVPLNYEWRFKDKLVNNLEEIRTRASDVAMLVSVGTEQPRFNHAPLPFVCKRNIRTKPRTAPAQRCRSTPGPLPSSLTVVSRPCSATISKERLCQPASSSECPFSISSRSGVIEPEATVKFQISFSPVEIGIYSSLLEMRIKGVSTEHESLQITLQGVAVSPICHLLVAISDCVEVGRHRSSLPIDSNTKVIEFEALGLTSPITKCFDVVNTTSCTYGYILKQIAPTRSPFSCLIPVGEIEPYKQVTLSFALFPQEYGTFESLWHLAIPDLNVTQPLLIIGRVREPSVLLSSTHVHMDQTFVGVPVSCSVILINNEDLDLKYNISGQKSSGQTKKHSGCDSHLEAAPGNGIIKAHSQTEIMCTHLPEMPGGDVLIVKFCVEKCQAPLLLHVHVSAFHAHPRLAYITHNKTVEELLPHQPNRINMNKLTPRIPSSIHFLMANIDKLPFNYMCDNSREECRLAKIEIYWNKKCGTVAYRGEDRIELKVIAISKISFKDFPVTIKVEKGPLYRVLLSGSAESAVYELSFKEHNFGHCLIHPSHNPLLYTTSLHVTNKDENKLYIESVSSALKNFLVSIPNDGVVKPRETIAIKFSFLPTEPKFYRDTIEFLINGVDQCKIIMSGEGHFLQVSLANPQQKCIDFGSVLIGRSERRVLTLINNSKAPAEISLITPEETVRPFQLEPSTKQSIGPHATRDFVLTFCPNEIISPFIVQLLLSFAGKSEPICLVKGKVMGAKFSYDRDYMTFGCIVLGSSATVKLMVHNEGDIGSHFNWDNSIPWLKIVPSCGFLSGRTSNSFNMTLTPKEVVGFFQKEIFCHFDCKYKIESLPLTVTGSCVAVPPPTDVIVFATPVRKKQIKSITLNNLSDELWTFSPVFSGEFFSGNKQVILDPYEEKSYDIHYEPLTMTKDEKKHEGNVFLPYLDGSCKLYKLVGTAQKPEAEAFIEWNIPCKVENIKSLDLNNWLPFPQRFTRSIEIFKSPSPDTIFTIDGNLYTELGSFQNRPYNLKIFCYQECSLLCNIIFRNEESSEYIWYEVSITFDPCPFLDNFVLETRVRQTACLEITLVKQLPCKASFYSNDTIDYVQTKLVSFDKGVEAKLTVTYLPLFVEEKRTCNLEILSSELGKFLYQLVLTADEPFLEEGISISTEIGSSTKLYLPVQNHHNESCTFIFQQSHPSFKCLKATVAEPGEKIELEVEFEPSSIGKILTKLEVVSKEAGNFRFPVTAYCTKPTPKGPLYVSSNKNTTVSIKNVFGSRKVFNWTVDNEAFIVKTAKLSLKPTEHLQLTISMKTSNESKKNNYSYIPTTGKLVINLAELNIDWVFYLRSGGD